MSLRAAHENAYADPGYTFRTSGSVALVTEPNLPARQGPTRIYEPRDVNHVPTGNTRITDPPTGTPLKKLKNIYAEEGLTDRPSLGQPS